MARAKVKITPLGRRIHSNKSQRSRGPKKSKGQELVGRDQDAENCPPNLDFNVIEEIANGVEKMILSWSHLDEGEQEPLEDEKEQISAMWTLPGENKVQYVGNSSFPLAKLCSETVLACTAVDNKFGSTQIS